MEEREEGGQLLTRYIARQPRAKHTEFKTSEYRTENTRAEYSKLKKNFNIT
jgi:hypothetical protein